MSFRWKRHLCFSCFYAHTDCLCSPMFFVSIFNLCVLRTPEYLWLTIIRWYCFDHLFLSHFMITCIHLIKRFSQCFDFHYLFPINFNLFLAMGAEDYSDHQRLSVVSAKLRNVRNLNCAYLLPIFLCLYSVIKEIKLGEPFMWVLSKIMNLPFIHWFLGTNIKQNISI